MFIQESNVYLRPLRIEDALVSYHWRNDHEVWKYTGNRPDRTITPEIESEWLIKVLSDQSSYRFAICVREGESTSYVGNIQLTGVNNDEAEYHIFIGDKSYWGKGIAKVATKLLLNIAFDQLKLNRIKLSVRYDYLSAIGLYKKCGFLPDENAHPNPIEKDGFAWLIMVKYKTTEDVK